MSRERQHLPHRKGITLVRFQARQIKDLGDSKDEGCPGFSSLARVKFSWVAGGDCFLSSMNIVQLGNRGLEEEPAMERM